MGKLYLFIVWGKILGYYDELKKLGDFLIKFVLLKLFIF